MKLKTLSNILLIITLTTIAFAQQVPAQAPAPSKYQPSEIEKLKLENLQQKAIIQQQSLNSLTMQKQVIETQLPQVQDQFNKAVTSLRAEGEKVRLAHGWQQVIFDPATLGYSDIPKAPVVPVTPKTKLPVAPVKP